MDRAGVLLGEDQYTTTASAASCSLSHCRAVMTPEDLCASPPHPRNVDMVSGQPPRPRRSSRNSEPPSSPTVEDNPASESPTEASVNPLALGEGASRRLAKAAAAAGAAAAASIPASRADITATAGIESAATVGLENAAPIDAAPAAVESAVPMESAAPLEAALAVLPGAAPKPRQTPRKALGPAGRSGKEPVVLLS